MKQDDQTPKYKGSGKGELGGQDPLWLAILKLPFQAIAVKLRGQKIPKD